MLFKGESKLNRINIVIIIPIERPECVLILVYQPLFLSLEIIVCAPLTFHHIERSQSVFLIPISISGISFLSSLDIVQVDMRTPVFH